MYITIVPYMYRDPDNFKAHGEIRLVGVLDDEDRAALKAALNVNDTFIPEQIGLNHLGWQEIDDWPSFPRDDDHVWHELLLDDIRMEEIRDFVRGPHTPESVDEFVERFTEAAEKGWDDTRRYSLDN